MGNLTFPLLVKQNKTKRSRLRKLSKVAWIANDSDDNGWLMIWFQGMQTEYDGHTNHEPFHQHHAFEIWMKCSYYNLGQTSQSLLSSPKHQHWLTFWFEHPSSSQTTLTHRKSQFVDLLIFHPVLFFTSSNNPASTTVVVTKTHCRICDGGGNSLGQSDPQSNTSSK